jgi:hypothetical protein
MRTVGVVSVLMAFALMLRLIPGCVTIAALGRLPLWCCGGRRCFSTGGRFFLQRCHLIIPRPLCKLFWQLFFGAGRMDRMDQGRGVPRRFSRPFSCLGGFVVDGPVLPASCRFSCMSAFAAIASALVSSSAVVAIPTAGILLANADVVPPEARAAIWFVGGITYVAVFLGNLGKALPVLRSLLGLPESKPVPPRPDPVPPGNYGAHLVTHQELEARLLRIEEKIDENAKEARDDLHSLTKTMEACFREMSKAIGNLEGKLSARAGL